MRKSSSRRLTQIGLSLILLGCLQSSCATAPREAAPLDIERTPSTNTLPAGPPTLSKVAYENVLTQSPGHFFQRMPVTPVLTGRKFVGYSILALYGDARPHPEGVFVGDIVTRVNGTEINTPEKFHQAWKAARGRRTLEVEVFRENTLRRITYRIID